MKRSAAELDKNTKNLAFINFYYKQLKNDEDHWKCKCGKIRKQIKNTGYTNLMNHLQTQHKDYVDVVQSQKRNGQLDLAGFTPCEAATQLFGWLDLIITDGYFFLYLFCFSNYSTYHFFRSYL